MKNNDWTPNEPTWLSFIAFKHLSLPAKTPSKVSIKPSRWSPPVIKYPEAKQIRTDAKTDQELFIKIRKIKLCANPMKNPNIGANWAMFSNFGEIKGNFGKVV